MVRLFGSASEGDVGVDSDSSRVRLTGLSHTVFVTRNLPTANTVTSPQWLLRCSIGLRAEGFLMRGHFFWLQRVQMFLCPSIPPMVCRWLQVCFGTPGGAPGETGVKGGVEAEGEVGVMGAPSVLSMLFS